MGKTRMVGVILALLLGSLAFASSEEAAQGKLLVDSKLDCGTASDEQLELIGEYLMEQMHPGEAHEYMDNMMGGEGSQSLRSVHIQMARAIYCGQTDTTVTYGGMMGMMPMMGRFAASGNTGMMGIAGYSGMMGSFQGMMGSGAFQQGGMMGQYGQPSILQDIFWLLGIVALVLAIIWLYTQITRPKGKN